MTPTTMLANGRNGKTGSSTLAPEDDSSTVALSLDSRDAHDGLLTLVEITRRIEPDERKHGGVLAKVKRLIEHESVRNLLGAVRAGGKGFRYPESAVAKLHFLVTNPLVSPANADEYLKTMTFAPTPGNALLTGKDASSTSALTVIGEVISMAIRQSGENSMSVLLPLMQRLTSALEAQAASVQAQDRAVTKAEAATLMGVAEIERQPAYTSPYLKPRILPAPSRVACRPPHGSRTTSRVRKGKTMTIATTN